jgi:hypothetical protein
MSSEILKLAYAAGRSDALYTLLGKVAAEDATYPPPDDASVALPIGGGNPDASKFVNFAQNDQTGDVMSARPQTASTANEKPVHWSGSSSLEGGDVGTRTMNMGLPRFGGV